MRGLRLGIGELFHAREMAVGFYLLKAPGLCRTRKALSIKNFKAAVNFFFRAIQVHTLSPI